MVIDLPALMKEKSDEGLRKYIDDYNKYTPEAIEAAIYEMQIRGVAFSEEETESFRKMILERKETIKKREEESSENFKWDENAVSDDSVPGLFSQKTIYLVSSLFGVITGAILLAINIKRTKRIKGIVPTIAFGASFTLLQILLLSYFNNARPVFGVAVVGAITLNEFLWKKYIGNDTKYRVVKLLIY